MNYSEENFAKARDSRLLLSETTVTLTLMNGLSIVTVADSYTIHLEEGWVNLHKDGETIYSRRLDDVMIITKH